MDYFPDELGPWVRGDLIEYPPPFGFSVPYSLEDGTVATLYLYDGGYDVIVPGVDSPEVREQFERAKAEIVGVTELGQYKSSRHLSEEVVQFGADDHSRPVLHAVYELQTQEGEQAYSHLFLTAITGLLAKIRLTFRTDDDDDRDEAIGGLLAWFSGLLRYLEEVRNVAAAGLQFRLEDLGDPPGTLINSLGMRLVPIPPGEFLMGGRPEEKEYDPVEERLHRVRITRPFFIGMFAVTQAEYVTVMGENPSLFHAKMRPVEHVSWSQAVEFCRRLSQRPEEQAAGRTYRLPTEAEWEYACRAGSCQAFSFGDRLLGAQAHFCATRVNSPQMTMPVGMFPPNAFGLCDMHGNVWEWCADWFSQDYYAVSPIDDPTGPPSGSHHVLRGGSASMEEHHCRAATRGEAARDEPDPNATLRIALIGDFGLRVVCEAPAAGRNGKKRG